MRLFLTGMIVALALFSCATVRLSDVKIAEMKVALFEGKSQVTGVIPGKTYRVIVVIRDEKNEMIDNPNYQDIMATSPDGTFIKIWTADDQTMFAQVNPESFSLLDTPCKLVLNINNNPFPQQTVSWQVDWKNYKVVDFSGEAGSDGESGENDLDKAENAMSCCAGCLGMIAAIAGRDTPAGSSSDSKPIAGRDGVSGGNGSSGKNGETVSLDVAYYRYQDMTGMVIFEKRRGASFLCRLFR